MARRAGGRPIDVVTMFKVLVLEALYSLSDDQPEFQIKDRLSFMRFLGLGLGDDVRDAKTIWLFRERLVRAGRDRKSVCLPASTTILKRPAIWPWAGKSWTQRSWPHRSSAT